MEKLELDGFLNIDKPAGPTSHDTCMLVRKILNTEPVGHAGTLDPDVTGVLPIAIGKATRLLRFLEHDKEYVGVMFMHKDIDREKIENTIKSHFIGKIKQIPPKKSRVKRVEREREIYSFEILDIKKRKVLFRVRCEKGTYIRKLIFDLGEKLGIGAHMIELRRTKAGFMDENDSISLYQLSEAYEEYKNGNPEKLKSYILPIDIIAEKMPKIFIKNKFIDKIYNGSPIYDEFIEKKDKLNRGQFAAVYCGKTLAEIAIVTLEGNKVAKPETVLKKN